MIEQHYKTTEIARLLSLNPETLRRAAARHEVRPYKVGKDWLWTEALVQEWLERTRPAAPVVHLTSRRKTQRSRSERSA